MMNAARNTSAVREPSQVELNEFSCLRDILVWASIKGNPDLYYTQAGSLLYAMAADEFRTIRADEFASIDPADFEEALSSWSFSKFDDDYGHGIPECDEKPTVLMKGRARAAHRAARIWNDIEWSAAAIQRYAQWKDEAELKLKEPNHGVAPASASTTPAVTGDMVRMHETVDITRVREVPMMSA